MKKCVEFTAPNLDATPSVLRPQALEAWARGDIFAVLGTMSSDRYWTFMADNLRPLVAKGLLEEAFVHAYTGVRVNLWPYYSVISEVVSRVNRNKLRCLGDPFPPGAPWTVYRGVAGRGTTRRVRGYSWTIDRDLAQWFANRFASDGLENPAVFTTTIEQNIVLFYSNERQEKDFVVALPPKHPVKRSV